MLVALSSVLCIANLSQPSKLVGVIIPVPFPNLNNPDDTFALLTATQTLTNKTIDAGTY